ncbi:MAG: hypothetical protein UR60_C0008G0001 [Candidatus Moranbacteria bacterium GW2011_GWF2_34_56]|nr:MAG: hypothetical protein UR51_C0002G0100 [Candidatus Moranbacteria bacterium GW2011_GWF1_34_10]KKP65129.1 MAG: hypothetical protein UR60_C0008G0001 [Candidatus Moranbacteria bacterium GW2011_GWF2_34_56]
MKNFGFENLSNNSNESLGKDKSVEFEKLLLEANEGKIPDEYTVEDGVEFDETKSGLAENIILKAQEMLRQDLTQLLGDEERKKMEEVIVRISNIKRSSAAELWASEVNRLMQNGGDVDNFKKLATDNLYKEMKGEVVGKLGINESLN